MKTMMKNNTFLFRFLRSYILIISLSLALFTVIYSKTVNILEEQVKQSNLSILEQSRDIIDRHVQELNSIVERVALDPNIVSLENMDSLKEGSPDIDLLIKAVDGLSAYRLSDSFLKEFYIYLNHSDIIMTSARATTSMRLQYGGYFKYGALSYDQWHALVVDGLYRKTYLPATPVIINSRSSSAITLMQTLPIDYPKSNRGCIMAFMDTGAVNQLLQKITIGSEGYTYILGSDNAVITSLKQAGGPLQLLDLPLYRQSGVMNIRVAGKEMVVSYAVSSVNQWKYVAVLPAEFVMQKVNSTRIDFLIVALLMLLVGLVLSWLFSYRNAKPLKEVYDSLKDFFGDGIGSQKSLSFLSSSVVSLIRSNRDLGERLKEDSPIIRTAFLRRLLLGKYRDVNEIQSNLAHLNIQLDGAAYCVVALAISGYRNLINQNILQELDVSRLYINRTIAEKTSGRAVSCDLEDTEVAFILSFDTTAEETIRLETEKAVTEIRDEIQNALQIEIAFAAGSICSKLTELSYSFSDAKQALAYAASGQKGHLLWFHQVRKKSDHYWYTIDMEQHIIEMVNSGKKDELERFLQSVRTMNFRERELTVPMLRLLVCQMTGTLSRISNVLQIDFQEDSLLLVAFSGDTEFAFDTICMNFMRFCEAVQHKRDKSDEALCNKILGYLEHSYMDESLTLYGVALHYNLSETYLYHFFKEQTGFTFSDYLEKLRMDQAYKMLTETGFSVGEIALKVGYGNVHSFRRAFKRCKGVIPSELRAH